MASELPENPAPPLDFSQSAGEKPGYDVKDAQVPRKTFTTPDHPAFKHLEKLKSQTVTVTTATIPPPYHRHDPHEKPQFTIESIGQPVSPVLYLPPLISSLPETLPPLPVPDGHPPMITETRLPDIDPVSLSLHKALHYFRPYDTKYANSEYKNAFNWEELVLPEQESREWYCVAFRSKRKDGSDGTPLYEADKKAHEEAVHNGGLLMYWYGVPDPDTGLNLATCIWQSRAHAVVANSRPHHIKAMRLAKDAYEVYELERYVLRKVPGETKVFIDEYSGGEVGW